MSSVDALTLCCGCLKEKDGSSARLMNDNQRIVRQQDILKEICIEQDFNGVSDSPAGTNTYELLWMDGMGISGGGDGNVPEWKN